MGEKKNEAAVLYIRVLLDHIAEENAIKDAQSYQIDKDLYEIAGGKVDFISAFMDYTKGAPTADIYRLWSAITCVAGALERRVWTVIIQDLPIYPNLYVLLVGTPGTGKTPAIAPVRRLWRSNPKLTIAADSLTKAGFFDAMEAGMKKIPAGGQWIEYASLCIAADELSMFMSAYDQSFIGSLTGAYDGRDVMGEQRRASLGARKRADIINPLATILAGAQPGFMNALLPEEVWGMGFTARFIMVYSNEQQNPELTFGQGIGNERVDELKALTESLARFGKIIGPYSWEQSAANELNKWNKSRCYPEPDHSRLIHYNTKRAVLIAKLSLISCASRGESQEIKLRDLERARRWLLHAETLMPNIFREMKGKSDRQVLEATYTFMWNEYAQTGNKPLHENSILNFLSDRAGAHIAPRLLEMLERTGMASRDAGTKLYTPRPKHLHGVE